jgi:putative ABC transport system ATP-binding protein
MTGADPIVRLEGVRRRFRGVTALGGEGGVDLAVRAGSWTVITGRSGAGKTTALQLLAGLDRPDAGRVWMFGRDVTRDSEGARSELRRRRLGIVAQECRFIDHLSVWQNVTCRLVPDGVSGAKRRARAAAVLETLGLERCLDRRPSRLSGGERQRVALARAIVARPDLLIADEPTSDVDAETGTAVIACLRTLRADGATIVCATHDPLVLAEADTRVTLEHGTVST